MLASNLIVMVHTLLTEICRFASSASFFSDNTKTNKKKRLTINIITVLLFCSLTFLKRELISASVSTKLLENSIRSQLNVEIYEKLIIGDILQLEKYYLFS